MTPREKYIWVRDGAEVGKPKKTVDPVTGNVTKSTKSYRNGALLDPDGNADRNGDGISERKQTEIPEAPSTAETTRSSASPCSTFSSPEHLRSSKASPSTASKSSTPSTLPTSQDTESVKETSQSPQTPVLAPARKLLRSSIAPSDSAISPQKSAAQTGVSMIATSVAPHADSTVASQTSLSASLQVDPYVLSQIISTFSTKRKALCDPTEVIRQDHKRQRDGEPGYRERFPEFQKAPEEQQRSGRGIAINGNNAVNVPAGAEQHGVYDSIDSLSHDQKLDVLQSCKVLSSFVKASFLDKQLRADKRREIGDSRVVRPGDILWLTIPEDMFDDSIRVDDPDRLTTSQVDLSSKTRPCVVYKREGLDVWVFVGRSYGGQGCAPRDLHWKVCQLVQKEGRQPLVHRDIVTYSSGMTGTPLTKLTFLEFGELKKINLSRRTYKFGGRLEPEGFRTLAERLGLGNSDVFVEAGKEVEFVREEKRREFEREAREAERRRWKREAELERKRYATRSKGTRPRRL